MKGTTLPVNSVLQSQGSLVYLDNGKSCDGAVTQGIGFTLGECIVRDNEGSGVVYSNCYSSGDQIKYFFTTCTDTICQEGCTTYSMSQNKCSTEAEPYNGQIVCSSSVDAYQSYSQFELVSKLVNLSKKYTNDHKLLYTCIFLLQCVLIQTILPTIIMHWSVRILVLCRF